GRLRQDIGFYRDALAGLRDNVERARSNMDAIFSPTADGPLADDSEVAGWVTKGVEDELADLDSVDRRLDEVETITRGATDPSSHTGRLFVIHGRDEQVRAAFFELFHALDLRPLEWEQLVTATSAATPFLGDVIDNAFEVARAAVVLLTPDDGAVLHPALRGP